MHNVESPFSRHSICRRTEHLEEELARTRKSVDQAEERLESRSRTLELLRRQVVRCGKELVAKQEEVTITMDAYHASLKPGVSPLHPAEVLLRCCVSTCSPGCDWSWSRVLLAHLP